MPSRLSVCRGIAEDRAEGVCRHRAVSEPGGVAIVEFTCMCYFASMACEKRFTSSLRQVPRAMESERPTVIVLCGTFRSPMFEGNGYRVGLATAACGFADRFDRRFRTGQRRSRILSAGISRKMWPRSAGCRVGRRGFAGRRLSPHALLLIPRPQPNPDRPWLSHGRSGRDLDTRGGHRCCVGGDQTDPQPADAW